MNLIIVLGFFNELFGGMILSSGTERITSALFIFFFKISDLILSNFID